MKYVDAWLAVQKEQGERIYYKLKQDKAKKVNLVSVS
jgi:hypothetical protein